MILTNKKLSWIAEVAAQTISATLSNFLSARLEDLFDVLLMKYFPEEQTTVDKEGDKKDGI